MAAPKRDNRRAFTQTQKNAILYQQNGKCAGTECKHGKLDPRITHFHHIEPWAAGGRTITENGVALCLICHGLIGHKERLAKIDGSSKPKKTKKQNKRKNSAKRSGSSSDPLNGIERSLREYERGMDRIGKGLF